MVFCFGSKNKSLEEERSKEIDEKLKRDMQKEQRQVKMLLLGTGESGKSTILKQMKLIHEGGYSQQERRSFVTIIYGNLAFSIKTLLEEMDELNLKLGDPDLETDKQMVLQAFSKGVPAQIPSAVFESIERLWDDPGVKRCFEFAGEKFYLIDSAEYFLNSCKLVSDPSYLPNEEDILRCRVKTTGITETAFQIGKLSYRMFDVGGQRSERKKWIHCFDNVNAIIFMVAVSEYDQNLIEDTSVNRMQEALTLFDSICNSRWFTNTNIILFLNKIDLFKKKIRRVPIKDYFPDYEGEDDYEAGIEYFKMRFERLNMNSGDKRIYFHETCATETKQIKFVMDSVTDIIVKSNLKSAGLL